MSKDRKSYWPITPMFNDPVDSHSWVDLLLAVTWRWRGAGLEMALTVSISMTSRRGGIRYL